MKFGTRLSCLSVIVATALGVSAASAHVTLVNPPPRLGGEEGQNQLKIGPCGQNQNGRTDTVTNFMGGETITVDFSEYINHTSYYRIALDVEGDDSFPQRPEASVSPDGDDPASVHPLSDINDPNLEVYILQYYTQDEGMFMQAADYSTEVQLPNIDCQNCTLQLIQFMYNDPEPHYYQCADITITAVEGGDTDGGAGGTTAGPDTTTDTSTASTGSGTTGAGGAAATATATTGEGFTTAGGVSTTTGNTTGGPTGTTGGPGATATVGGVTSAAASGAATTGTPAATAATVTSTTGGVPPTAAKAEEEDGGCAFRGPPTLSSGGWLGALLGLGLLGYRRRPRGRF